MITEVKDTVDSDPVPVAPMALEVELSGYGGFEELERALDESPDEYGEVTVGMMEEWVLVFDLL